MTSGRAFPSFLGAAAGIGVDAVLTAKLMTVRDPSRCLGGRAVPGVCEVNTPRRAKGSKAKTHLKTHQPLCIFFLGCVEKMSLEEAAVERGDGKGGSKSVASSVTSYAPPNWDPDLALMARAHLGAPQAAVHLFPQISKPTNLGLSTYKCPT